MSELKSHPRCFFCGGRGCKYENWKRWIHKKDNHNAIDGVYSNWVTDRIVACARFKQRDVVDHDIVGQFLKYDIGAIINLQERNEHPYCGDGNLKSGFSYDPETFMAQGVHFYHMGWPDLGVPTFDKMVDIVQIMSFVLSSRTRIAVHCHAGLGRTGLTIACYLVFEYNIDPIQAILDVRAHRSRAVQNKKQEEFVVQFHQKLNELRLTFALNSSRFLLEDYLRRQRRYLHGGDVIRYRFTPKITQMLLDRILELSSRSGLDATAKDFCNYHLSAQELNRLQIVKDGINNGTMRSFADVDQVHILAKLLVCWFAHLKEPLIPRDKVEILQSKSDSEDLQVINELQEYRRRTLLQIVTFTKKFESVEAGLYDRMLVRIANCVFGNDDWSSIGELPEGELCTEDHGKGKALDTIIKCWKPVERSAQIYYPLTQEDAKGFTDMIDQSSKELGLQVSPEQMRPNEEDIQQAIQEEKEDGDLPQGQDPQSPEPSEPAVSPTDQSAPTDVAVPEKEPPSEEKAELETKAGSQLPPIRSTGPLNATSSTPVKASKPSSRQKLPALNPTVAGRSPSS